MRNTRTLAPMLVVGLVALAGTVPTAGAQRPERPPEGRVSAEGVAPKLGWQLLVHDGCQFAVPGSWRAAPDGDMVMAPDGISNLSVRRFRILNWSEHKAHIRATFVHLKIVHEDSDHRFWFEIGNENSTVHYIAVRDGLSACIGLMEIRATAMPMAEGTENGIVASIRAAGVH